MRPHLNEWRKIGQTIDAARAKPAQTRKPWPFYAVAELQRHQAGFPDTELYYSDEDLFR